MTNIYQLPLREQRYDEASLWIEKLGEGLSAEEAEELRRWMAADEANEALLFKMAGLWDKMDALSRLSALFPEPALRPQRSAPRRNRWRRAVLAAAASVLVGLTGVWTVLSLDRLAPADSTAVTATAVERLYETAIGEQASVTLTDGTELTLNTQSRVRVEFAPTSRLLVLEAGEMHVQVTKDPARPLSVIADDNIVQAVGTAFNVKITQDDRIELVVTEGKVRVGARPRAEKPAEPVAPIALPDSSVTVSAGEEMILGAPEEIVRPMSETDIEVKLSWREGKLIFRGEPLGDAVAEVGRYTAVEFVILDDDLRKVRVAGIFKAGDVDGLLAVLHENFDIDYERVDDQKVVLSAQ